MDEMTHIMIDTETTGTDPHDTGVIQIAAVKYNPRTRQIGAIFDRCPAILPRRHWSASTRKFWLGHREVYDRIIAREEPADQVYKDFSRFCSEGAPFGGYVFVAKPVKFDWPIMESQFNQLGLPFPFAHHKYLDLNSHISGLLGEIDRVDIENEVQFKGNQHDALHDCAYQIDCHFWALKKHAESFAEIS